MKIIGAADNAHKATLSKFAAAFGISRLECSEDFSEIIIERAGKKWRIYALNVQNFETVHIEEI